MQLVKAPESQGRLISPTIFLHRKLLQRLPLAYLYSRCETFVKFQELEARGDGIYCDNRRTTRLILELSAGT